MLINLLLNLFFVITDSSPYIYSIEFTILDQDYNDALNDPESDRFKEMSTKIKTKV